MRGLRKLVPDDFGCDAERGLCRGLDTHTMMMALCHMLLTPLFEFATHDAPLHELKRAQALMERCVTRRRAERISPPELLAELERLVPRTRVLPKLALTNDAERYLEIKTEFEQVRHESDLKTLKRFGVAKGTHAGVEAAIRDDWLR